MKIKNRLICRFLGHKPDIIITGFQNPSRRAIGRCFRCNIPILLKYIAAPYLFKKYQQNYEREEGLILKGSI